MFTRIPCPHESKGISTSITVPDFHPLTRDEVCLLLGSYITINCTQLAAQIQIRFNQAIPGMKCPRPTEGPVAEKMSQLDSLLVKCRTGKMPRSVTGIVGKIMRILKS